MSKKALNRIIIFLCLTLIALACLNYYLYRVRFVEKVNITDKRVDVTNNSITKADAESLTIKSLIQKKSNLNLTQVSLNPLYKLTESGITQNVTNKESVIPLIYTTIDSPNLNDTKVIELISTLINTELLEEVDIDVSITNKVSNIEEVIKGILLKSDNKNLKINLGLPLKWSDYIDYNYLKEVSLFYESSASIEVLNNICNKIRIDSYGYTSVKSSQSGPITKTDITQRALEYYIYKGINANKIDLVINTRAYLWGNRSYADSYLYNYTLNSVQVNILPEAELNSLLSNNQITTIMELNNFEILGVMQEDGKVQYIVYPLAKQKEFLINLATEYGLNGYIIIDNNFFN